MLVISVKINKMFRSTNKFINYLLYPGQNIAGKLKNELFIFWRGRE